MLVIGGGITGAGVALDAASRGLKTALVEKDDFASGTSSKSSKLVHGGLRYLQQHEYRLVYENLAERQRLLDNAPYLVSPLPFLIPLFGKEGVVNASVARVYRTALWLYDLTGGVRIGHRHEKVTQAQALQHMPTLRADRLVAGFLYWDARTDDARLTLTVLRTAVLDHGAVAVNHAPVTALTTGPGGKVNGAHVEPSDAPPFDIRASVVVNAAGVWSDQVRALDEGADPHSIRPAKGIHITVPEAAFPCDIAAVIPVREDRRSIFVVSWGDQVYLGTTDTDWHGPLDDPSCLPEDVDYILDAANAITTSPIGRSDIRGVWAGLRPLLAPAAGRHAPSERTADLSRRHTVGTSPRGMVTVTGGKLTTYRKMAEDTVDVVVRALGRRRLPCVTKDLRLRGARPGAPRPVPEGAKRLGPPGRRPSPPTWPAATDQRRRPSCRWPTAILSCWIPWCRDCVTSRPRPSTPPRAEMACSVADVLDRRTRASLRDARGAAAAAAEVAALIGPELGWDERARPAGGRGLRRRHRRRADPGRTRPLRPRWCAGHSRGGYTGRSRLTRPTPVTPIDAGPDGITDRLGGTRVAVDAALRRRLDEVCAEVTDDDGERAEAGRDWWPLAIGWAPPGRSRPVPRWWLVPPTPPRWRPYWPSATRPRYRSPPAGGRSGVCGASIPVFGGVALDLCGLAGIGEVDATSLVADLRAGTFGPDVESGLRQGHGLTLGHWPQSMDLSTVGGWLACRGAGQYSNRYGKIEDMVIGLEVVLADGRVIRTGGHAPRSATGPDLTQLFVGSEGTLGVITEGRFRVHPVPEGEGRRAFGFATFDDGLDACRRILRRGAAPAVLRLYDPTESARSFDLADTNVLIVLDEADPALVDATLAVVDERVRRGRAVGRRPGRPVARPPQRRVRSRPSVAGRHRGRHRRGGGPMGDPARPHPGGARRPGLAGGHPGRLVPPVTRLPGRRLPLLHLCRSATRPGR